MRLLLFGAIALSGRGWLANHPGDDPWAPLDLRDPPGWTTQRKLAELRGDPAQCSAVLERSQVAFTAREPAGSGPCRRNDRIVLTDTLLSPAGTDASCAVAAGLQLWLDQGVQSAAEVSLGSPVARIEHYGTYSCRRLYGRDSGPWSEHATGNAIDIAGFVLEDGRRISVLRDWEGKSEKARFLHAVRDAACEVFGTTLSPDYNAAHRNHFHLDQAARGFSGACR